MTTRNAFRPSILPYTLLASMAAMTLAAPIASAQQSPDRTTLWSKKDGAQSAKVERLKTTCSLTWTDEAASNGFSFNIGQTVITSQFGIFGGPLPGENLDELTLYTRRLDGISQVSTPFARKSIGKVGGKSYYRYGTGLFKLDMDYDALTTIGGFMLASDNPQDGNVTVQFDGVLRDEAVAELGKCIARLDKSWSLARERP